MPPGRGLASAASLSIRKPLRETRWLFRAIAPRRLPMRTSIVTPHGTVDVDPSTLELGTLVGDDELAELEVVALDPLRFELAPEEEEDWGE
jgi:lysine biosynthesis protein LysW